MAWQLTPYTIPLAASTVVGAALTLYGTFYLWRREFEPSVTTFVFLLVGVTIWAGGYTLMLSSTDLAAKRRFLRVLWIGSAIVPTAWLLFALTYAERESWLTRPLMVLLSIQPAATILLLVSPLSWPMWSEFTLDTTANPFVTLAFSLGPWYQFTVGYSWLLTLVGLLVLVWFVVDSEDLYRGQSAALLVGGVSPFVGSVAFFTGLYPHPNVNPTAAGFAVSGLAFGVAVFRYRLLDVVPVATDTVVDRMRDGYVVLDDSGQVVDANPAAMQFTATDTVVGEPVERVLPFDLDDATNGETGSGQSQEFVVEDDDETQFVEVRRSPLAGDRRAGDLLLLRDVTAQRQVERRYQRLIERASDIIVVLDADGIVQYQSPSIRRVLGQDPDDIEGESAFDFVHPDDRDRVRDRFEEIVETPGTTDRIEYRVPHASGEWRTIESIVKNLLEDPFVEGVVLNGRDVTEHRERERELERQNERLDEFAGVVSHDLRNPLQVASARARMAQERGEPEHFEHLHGALDRMDRIIDDVLTLAREGDAIQSTSNVDVGTVAGRAWDTVSTDRATLEVGDSTSLDADPDRLQQLFENLFRNAVEHSEGAVTVTVGSLADDPGFYVADDGPGIHEDERDDVFESGYTTAEDGTGFGLAIVAEIAEGHGWTPRITASDAGGARFELVLE